MTLDFIPPEPTEEEFPKDSPFGNDNKTATLTGLPHSKEAEEACIGSILINPGVLYDLDLILKDRDYYIHRLRFIWQAFIRLRDRHEPIDILTVSEELDDMGNLDEIGGQAYLTALLNQVPTTLHAEAYAHIVKACSVRREILVRSNTLATLAYDEAKPMDEILAEWDRVTNTQFDTAMNTNVPAEVAALRLMTRIQEARDNPQALAVPVYGIPAMQQALGGWPRKAVVLLYGDSSIGKTALMLQVAEETAKQKLRVLYITLESNADAMVGRRVFGMLKIDGKYARSGVADDDTQGKIEQGIRDYMDAYAGYLEFNEEAWTLSGFNQAVRQFQPDLIIVDYLAEMTSEDESRENNETRTLLKNLRGIKKTVKRTNAACVVIHSMTDDAIKTIRARKNDNIAPPLEGSLGWAKDLRYIMDIGVCMVESVERKGGNPLRVFGWVMKDRESGNLKRIDLDYFKTEQIFKSAPRM